MPQITISDSTFGRLQSLAKPFVDTEDAVISRALDRLESDDTESVPNGGDKTKNSHQIDPANLPDLTHTKVRYAVLDGKPIRKQANWNGILDKLLCLAYKRLGFDDLLKISLANITEGHKGNEGYHYLQEADISVQGTSASLACQAIVGIANEIGLSVDIGFEWRKKDGAAHPGERAKLFMQGRAADIEKEE